MRNLHDKIFTFCITARIYYCDASECVCPTILMLDIPCLIPSSSFSFREDFVKHIKEKLTIETSDQGRLVGRLIDGGLR